MSKFCIKCGAELTKGSKFCVKCGQQIPSEKPVKQPTPPPVPVTPPPVQQPPPLHQLILQQLNRHYQKT